MVRGGQCVGDSSCTDPGTVDLGTGCLRGPCAAHRLPRAAGSTPPSEQAPRGRWDGGGLPLLLLLRPGPAPDAHAGPADLGPRLARPLQGSSGLCVSGRWGPAGLELWVAQHLLETRPHGGCIGALGPRPACTWGPVGVTGWAVSPPSTRHPRASVSLFCEARPRPRLPPGRLTGPHCAAPESPPQTQGGTLSAL